MNVALLVHGHISYSGWILLLLNIIIEPVCLCKTIRSAFFIARFANWPEVNVGRLLIVNNAYRPHDEVREYWTLN